MPSITKLFSTLKGTVGQMRAAAYTVGVAVSM